jgi:hypothetical protein
MGDTLAISARYDDIAEKPLRVCEARGRHVAVIWGNPVRLASLGLAGDDAGPFLRAQLLPTTVLAGWQARPSDRRLFLVRLLSVDVNFDRVDPRVIRL